MLSRSLPLGCNTQCLYVMIAFRQHFTFSSKEIDNCSGIAKADVGSYNWYSHLSTDASLDYTVHTAWEYTKTFLYSFFLVCEYW